VPSDTFVEPLIFCRHGCRLLKWSTARRGDFIEQTAVAFILLHGSHWTEDTMRAMVLVMFVTAGLLLPGVSAAQRAAEQQLTLRIHDYARVGPKVLMRTQRLVSDSYRSIGVRTAWAETLHPFSDREEPADCCAAEDLTIIVLTPRMAELTRFPKDAVGCAVVGRGGGGRVAYIRYDRVKASAIQADWDAGDFMAFVVAHEVGHLLLPIGSHSPDGLMRGQWDVTDLRRTDPRALSFTPRQAELIRDTLGTVTQPAASTGLRFVGSCSVHGRGGTLSTPDALHLHAHPAPGGGPPGGCTDRSGG
jgi:hypothetical protein